MDNEILKLKNMIDKSDNIVFFGGAGVSTASGIPDFRGTSGLYSEDKTRAIPYEVMLSSEFFFNYTKEFYNFYKTHMVYEDAIPNNAHKYLATLEKSGKLKGIITQNIDGLHQAAGSQNVVELHGTIHKNRCNKCGKEFSLKYIMDSEGVPKCDACGGTVKPKVVLYGECLDELAIEKAIDLIRKANLLIVGGTSLKVYPANSFISEFNGENVVLINKEATNYDRIAKLILRQNIADIFGELM
ncbi:MAG: NAD-dependent protein deacylase [Clostridia bacterium]